jgi:hypothetical protein
MGHDDIADVPIAEAVNNYLAAKTIECADQTVSSHEYRPHRYELVGSEEECLTV